MLYFAPVCKHGLSSLAHIKSHYLIFVKDGTNATNLFWHQQMMALITLHSISIYQFIKLSIHHYITITFISGHYFVIILILFIDITCGCYCCYQDYISPTNSRFWEAIASICYKKYVNDWWWNASDHTRKHRNQLNHVATTVTSAQNSLPIIIVTLCRHPIIHWKRVSPPPPSVFWR